MDSLWVINQLPQWDAIIQVWQPPEAPRSPLPAHFLGITVT